MSEIFLISYEYVDKSGFGTVGAWNDMAIAQAVMALLEKHGDISKVFRLTAVPIEKSGIAEGQLKKVI